MITRLTGLIAATHTPTLADGRLNLDAVERQAEHLVATQVSGAFVAGTTGEALSFSVPERQALAKRWIEVSRRDSLKVIVHVGHNCLADAQALAAHAEQHGAAAIAAFAPSYFRPPSVESLIRFMKELAGAAPLTPFYYYDIPSWTGVRFPVADVLASARQQIPTFAGIKLTNMDLAELQSALHSGDGAFDILWGCDEALLAGLALGCRGAVGSTYNFAAPLYHRVINSFECGDLATARIEQARAVSMVKVLADCGFTAAAKSVMAMISVDCGPVRLPLSPLADDRQEQLRSRLTEIGFFDWIKPVLQDSCRHGFNGPHLPPAMVSMHGQALR